MVESARNLKSNPMTNLEKLLADPRSDEYFGHSFVLKCEVLAHVLTGNDSLPEIAKRRGLSRQAAYKYATKARRIYGLTTIS